MFESCISAFAEAINIQRRGNFSKIRVSLPSAGDHRQGLNPAGRQHSFLVAFLWDLAFTRNWSLASGFCTSGFSDRNTYCEFSGLQSIGSVSYPGPSGHAVSEGSISCYLNNHVIYRVARFTYGVKCTREFEQNDPEHQRRRRGAFVNPSGRVFLPDGYQAILKKARRFTISAPGC